MVRKTPTRWRRRLLFTAVVYGFLFLVLEIPARVACARRFGPAGTSVAVQGGSRWVAHPVLVWTHRPGYLLRDGTASFDEYGMRVPPGELRMPEKTEREFRVFLFGGSAMAGMGSNLNGDWIRLTGVGDHPRDRSIDGQLERILQEALPDRDVRVFNAATASHRLLQSRLYYERVRHLEPDWVVSMDGVNDPHALAPDASQPDQLGQEWRDHPTQRFPIAQASWFMSRSAVLFLLGDWLYFDTNLLRHAYGTPQDPALVERWSTLDPPPEIPDAVEDPAAHERAVLEFLRQLRLFDQALEADGRPHLLLVQPHLSLRDPERLGSPERSLWHYQMNETGWRRDAFLEEVHARVAAAAPRSIVPMDEVHRWPEWVFVDYCHFTAEANERIAREIAGEILGKGRAFAGE